MKKKHSIIDTATRLFATQGFDGTTTLQIAREAGVTEPLIYYHFEGKDDLFTHIIDKGFRSYFEKLDTLSRDTATQFAQIENMIALHFQFVRENPDEIYLAFSTCPAKLKDPEHVCTRNIAKQKKWLHAYLRKCLEKGIKSGEFTKVPIKGTISLLNAMIIGIVRQRGLRLDSLKGMKSVAVSFCRRSLVRESQ